MYVVRPPAPGATAFLGSGTGAALTPEAKALADRKASARTAVCCVEKCMVDGKWILIQAKLNGVELHGLSRVGDIDRKKKEMR